MPKKFQPDTPMEHLVHEVEQLSNLPIQAEVQESFQHLKNIILPHDQYILSYSNSPEAILNELEALTRSLDLDELHKTGKTKNRLTQEMLTGKYEGQVLQFLTTMIKPEKILEIGMFTGYAALAILLGAPNNAKLITCEKEAFLTNLFQTFIDKYGLSSRVDIHQGDAKESLETLARNKTQFDLIFIDADKTGYLDYYHLILDNNLLSKNGLLCIDNTLMKGKVYYNPSIHPDVEAIHHFNEFIKNDTRVSQVLLPVRDGLTLIKWSA